MFLQINDNWAWVTGEPTVDEIAACNRPSDEGERRAMLRVFLLNTAGLVVWGLAVLVVVYLIVSQFMTLHWTYWLGAMSSIGYLTYDRYKTYRKPALYGRLNERLHKSGRIHDPKQSLLRYVLQKEGDAGRTRRLLDKYPLDTDEFLTNPDYLFIRSQLGAEADRFLHFEGEKLVLRLRAIEQAENELGKQVAREMIERHMQ